MRIDGKSEWKTVLDDLGSLLGGRRKFFEGGEVSLEWLDRLPTKEQSKELEDFLQVNYSITVNTRPKKTFPVSTGKPAAQRRVRRDTKTIHLFEEIDGGKSPERPSFIREEEGALRKGRIQTDPFFGDDSGITVDPEREEAARVARSYVSRIASYLGEDFCYEDDANAKMYFGTLRSGQRLETPYSLVVVGDVNPGADLIAGGDIIVLGSLRGTAHAGAYEDDAQTRVIVAFHMQPMQLRIGSVISRGSDEVGAGPEIARIDSRRIIVESFNARALASRHQRRLA